MALASALTAARDEVPMFDEVAIPRLVVAGVQSSGGKTTVALGLAAALRRRGLVVQTFKVGADLRDGAYLAHVSGRPCRNLDVWMLGEVGVRRALARGAVEAEVAVIEGAMGIFDGRGLGGPAGHAFPGSTAEVAQLLSAPVLLVLDVSSVGETAAALALGVRTLDPSLHIAGTVLNNVANEYHRRLVEDAIWNLAKVPVLGALPHIEAVSIPERHRGLVPVTEYLGADAAIDQLATAVERHCDVDLILRLMRGACAVTVPPAPAGAATDGALPVRIGVAFDEAFSAYYPENLELLAEAGAEIVPFSPLEERSLPRDLDGIYLGGGCTEVYAERLARNRGLAEALQRAVAVGLPVYAEGGGLLYAARTLCTADGDLYEMAGLLPVSVTVADPAPRAGHRELELMAECMLGPRGLRLRGHEYHAPTVVEATDVGPLYAMHDSHGQPLGCEGWASGALIASLVQLHFGQDPRLAPRIVAAMRAARRERKAATAAV